MTSALGVRIISVGEFNNQWQLSCHFFDTNTQVLTSVGTTNLQYPILSLAMNKDLPLDLALGAFYATETSPNIDTLPNLNIFNVDTESGNLCDMKLVRKPLNPGSGFLSTTVSGPDYPNVLMTAEYDAAVNRKFWQVTVERADTSEYVLKSLDMGLTLQPPPTCSGCVNWRTQSIYEHEQTIFVLGIWHNADFSITHPVIYHRYLAASDIKWVVSELPEGDYRLAFSNHFVFLLDTKKSELRVMRESPDGLQLISLTLSIFYGLPFYQDGKRHAMDIAVPPSDDENIPIYINYAKLNSAEEFGGLMKYVYRPSRPPTEQFTTGFVDQLIYQLGNLLAIGVSRMEMSRDRTHLVMTYEGKLPSGGPSETYIAVWRIGDGDPIELSRTRTGAFWQFYGWLD